MKPLLTDDIGFMEFLIEVEEDVECSMDFKVYEVSSCECDLEHTPIDTELYIHGTIRWDGCSHVYFGNSSENGISNGYLHLCGKRCWEKHNKMMSALFDLASVTIKHWNKDVAE